MIIIKREMDEVVSRDATCLYILAIDENIYMGMNKQG